MQEFMFLLMELGRSIFYFIYIKKISTINRLLLNGNRKLHLKKKISKHLVQLQVIESKTHFIII